MFFFLFLLSLIIIFFLLQTCHPIHPPSTDSCDKQRFLYLAKFDTYILKNKIVTPRASEFWS